MGRPEDSAVWGEQNGMIVHELPVCNLRPASQIFGVRLHAFWKNNDKGITLSNRYCKNHNTISGRGGPIGADQ